MFLVFVFITLLVSLAVAVALDWRYRSWRLFYRFLLGVLSFGATISLLWICLVAVSIVLLFEPWPLSLRQGPDTEYARSCYARHLSPSPPDRVTHIYCREEWGFGGDSIYSIRFSFRDESILPELIRHLRLERVDPKNQAHVRYLHGPSWWATEAQLGILGLSWSVFVA
jgi:hypothetical protein